MLDMYGGEGGFRDYPRVVFVGVKHVGAAGEGAAEKDVRGMLAFLGKVAGLWTDGSLLERFVKEGGDALVAFGRECRTAGHTGEVKLKDVKSKWWEVAEKGREEGPERLPHQLAMWIHDDLASESALSDARKVVLHRFGASIGRFRELVGDEMEE